MCLRRAGVFAYFLFPCYLCQVAGKMKENCCVAFLGWQFGEIGVMLMRTKMRTAFGIQVRPTMCFT